ncbi:MAG: GTP cyclohydrolase II [Chloroflexota bacterium]|nr:GTP cyclohydrolase II [Chloroflexota bacterium]
MAIASQRARHDRVRHLSTARLPTRLGSFDALAFRDSSDGSEPVALVHGDIHALDAPLVRVHSECWTGDVLGSLRCDCGDQLARSLAAITAEGAGVLLYLRQEGRGIGLARKLTAYALQDGGLDTVDANSAQGLPVDAREYGAAAAILAQLGISRIRLMTNNPDKVEALITHGVEVVERVPLPSLANPINLSYLETKSARLGHMLPRERVQPLVTVHYAQTLDGRLATRTGDSQWISGQPSLVLAHRLRTLHDAVMVGAGTVLADDPRLTARLVEGPSPTRVVVDSTLRLPPSATLVNDRAAPTILATTERASAARRQEFTERGAEVMVLPSARDGRVDLATLLERLGQRGLATVLVEGGAGVITAMLRERRVRRLVVSIAPLVLGAGIEAVGELDIMRLRDALTFRRASFSQVGPDVIFEGELEPALGDA